MASRTEAGARILQTANVLGVRHTGEKLPIGRSSDDVVVSREDNTGYRPPDGAPTRG